MLDRRSFMRLTLAAVAGTTLSACGASSPSRRRPNVAGREVQPHGDGKTLLVYFSRAGENYWHGGRRNLKVGNTEVLAEMIAARLTCDVHQIEAADPYSTDYDDTVARNVREQQADARPAIANPPPSIDEYDTVLLASPIWNLRPPMIMLTFAERYDFTGMTVFPVTTYAMSGLGTSAQEYRRACKGARMGEGLAVRGEEARGAGQLIDEWVRTPV
jgi:flavodoxin